MSLLPVVRENVPKTGPRVCVQCHWEGTVLWGCGLGLQGSRALSGDPFSLTVGPYLHLRLTYEGREGRLLVQVTR